MAVEIRDGNLDLGRDLARWAVPLPDAQPPGYLSTLPVLTTVKLDKNFVRPYQSLGNELTAHNVGTFSVDVVVNSPSSHNGISSPFEREIEVRGVGDVNVFLAAANHALTDEVLRDAFNHKKRPETIIHARVEEFVASGAPPVQVPNGEVLYNYEYPETDSRHWW